MSVRRRWVGLALAVAVFATLLTGSLFQLMSSEQATQRLTMGDRIAPLTFALFTIVGATIAPRAAIVWLRGGTS